MIKIPNIIQGGMGAGVSDWQLARAVSTSGELGVVSGTALDLILVRRLQRGDPGGHVRRAMMAFPDRVAADKIISAYFVEGGIPTSTPYANKPLVGDSPPLDLLKLIVIANFVEVFLAKDGHESPVGINYLEKIQTPLLPSLYGALLAGVDVILVGAGVPVAIPTAIESLRRHEPARLPLAISGERAQATDLQFDPRAVLPMCRDELPRPHFLPIVSSLTMANLMVKRTSGAVDGFVIEYPSAGGHNAPPRGRLKLDGQGEPVYGPRDAIDIEDVRALGLPFWLGGSFGSASQLEYALAQGASGIQVGTLFAFCKESGLAENLKHRVKQDCLRGTLKTRTDTLASPTGFPFKTIFG